MLKLPAVSRRVFRAGVDLLYPPQCALCEASLAGGDGEILLCNVCQLALAQLELHACRRCGTTAPRDLPVPDTCAACSALPWHFQRVFCLGPYDSLLRTTVLQMKHPGRYAATIWAVARLLAERQRAAVEAWKPDVIVPIPLHWTRRLRRGGNTADDLAQQIGRQWKIEVAPQLLARTRRTPSQGELNKQQRFKNVRGAFAVSKRVDVTAARVLLVDDVLTTGATCSAAAKALRRAGAAAVATAVVARAQYFQA